ncbi:membrane dipeptidase [Stenotrophomonas rhizophila]|uniref:dipeptidase n=1 Tax=Stenotrophomonas rhizophila TaxID=216778 RepID=UPI000F4D28E7|nr:membrane dipeptidase [Stenotrophomonas rhizophila]ROP80247.1 membrane dipeptidase [Stenotrophomonas rhizophila]
MSLTVDAMNNEVRDAEPSRRRFLGACALGAAGAILLPTQAGAASPAGPGRSQWPGYRRATVIDALSGGPLDTKERVDYAPLSARSLADARTSGLTACTITVSGVGSYLNDYALTMRNIAYWNEQRALHEDALSLVLAGADLVDAKRSGRLGLIYGFQDSTPFGEDIERFDTFHGLGVRIYQLTYNRRNLVGDGCLEPANAGLSRFGRELIEKIDTGQGLIDLSHAGQRTTLDAIAASRHPVTISHTGCAALADNPRNKTDEELRQLAGRGGVAGIYLMPFLREQGQPMAEDLIRHIEHAIQVCGEEHVCLGTDGMISSIDLTPEYRERLRGVVEERIKLGISAPGESADVVTFLPDLNQPDRFDRLAFLLSRRGHSDARIEKILGSNFARVFMDVCG